MFSKCVLDSLQPQMVLVMSVNSRILQNNSICLMLLCMGIIMAYTKDSKIIPSKKFQLWLKVFRVVMVIVQTILVSTRARRNWLRHKRVIGQLAGYLYKQCKQQLLWSWNVPLLWFCFSFWAEVTPEKLFPCVWNQSHQPQPLCCQKGYEAIFGSKFWNIFIQMLQQLCF